MINTNTKNDTLNKLCISYMKKKSIYIVKCNKSITTINNKFEKVYIDFWGLYNSLF